MRGVIPIMATAETSAKLMEMKRAKFLDLVSKGYLPQPVQVAPGIERWETDELRKIGSGEILDEEFEV